MYKRQAPPPAAAAGAELGNVPWLEPAGDPAGAPPPGAAPEQSEVAEGVLHAGFLGPPVYTVGDPPRIPAQQAQRGQQPRPQPGQQTGAPQKHRPHQQPTGPLGQPAQPGQRPGQQPGQQPHEQSTGPRGQRYASPLMPAPHRAAATHSAEPMFPSQHAAPAAPAPHSAPQSVPRSVPQLDQPFAPQTDLRLAPQFAPQSAPQSAAPNPVPLMPSTPQWAQPWAPQAAPQYRVPLMPSPPRRSGAPARPQHARPRTSSDGRPEASAPPQPGTFRTSADGTLEVAQNVARAPCLPRPRFCSFCGAPDAAFVATGAADEVRTLACRRCAEQCSAAGARLWPLLPHCLLSRCCLFPALH